MTQSREPSERTCIVTRQTRPVDALIRFVVAPDGAVVADLRRRLPGRGVWVTATAESVRMAENRRLFGKAFEGSVTVAPDLAGRVEDQLRTAATGALALARKAGTLVAGFAKVEAALGRGNVVALIHAPGAGADGVAKLAKAAKRAGNGTGMPVIDLYTAEQLSLAFGDTNVVHAALLAGPASDNVLSRVKALADFLGEDGRVEGLNHHPEETVA